MRQARVVLVCIAGLAASALGQSKEWDGGAGSTDWFAGLNWDPDGVPGSNDAVLVQGVVPVAQAADINVRSLLVDTGLVLDSRSLILAEPSTITGFTLQGCCTRSITTQQLLTLNGVTTLAKGTIFGGPGGATIAGTATSAEIVRVNGTLLTIAGSLVASGNVEPWSGGIVDVTGTLALRAPGDLDEVSGGLTRLSSGGQIGMLGANANDQVTVDARLEADAGTLFADRGILDLRGEYALESTTIDVTDGGEVWFTGSFPNDIESVTFQGDGSAELRNANNTYKGVISANLTEFGRGLELFGTTRLDGMLTNSGVMNMGTLLTSPAGTGSVATSGKLYGSGTTEVPIVVLDGGELELPHQANLVLKADVDVFSGGELVLGSGEGSSTLSKPSNGVVGRVFCEGTIRAYDAMNCVQTTQIITSPVDLLPGALVKCDSGELVLSGGGNWSGGTIAPGSNCLGLVSVNGFNITHTITGDVTVRASSSGSVAIGGNGHTLSVTGTLRTEGVAENPLSRVILFGRTIGPGQIVHQLEQLKLGSGFDLGTTLVNDALVKVDGGIQIRGELRNEVDGDQHAGIQFEGGSLVNNGNWVIRAAGDQQLGSGGTVTNTGVYQAGFDGAGGLGHRVFVRFDNTGSVLAHDANVELHDVAQIVNNELTGGAWFTLGSGTIAFPGTSVTKVSGPGTLVGGDTSAMPWLGDLAEIEDGRVDVTGDSTFSGGIGVDGAGTLGVGDGVELDAGGELDLKSVTTDIQGVIALALLPAPATIIAPQTNCQGRLIPGGFDRAGQFDFVGAVTMFSDAQLLIDVGGTDNTDAVTATGPVTLDGTLHVSLIDEFMPEGGESYRLIDAPAGVSGAFTSFDLPDLGAGLMWRVEYSGTAVTLEVVDDCVADWNGDGSVNTQDFLAYLNNWSTQRLANCGNGVCSADLNGDDAVNSQDFLAFLNLWTGGC